MTIAKFLLAQIAEDEDEASSCHRADCEQNTYDAGPCDCGLPARALAECEAKRRIVNRHRNCGTGYGYCDDGGHGWDDKDGPGCGDLADLASVYADRPEFRDEWRVW